MNKKWLVLLLVLLMAACTCIGVVAIADESGSDSEGTLTVSGFDEVHYLYNVPGEPPAFEPTIEFSVQFNQKLYDYNYRYTNGRYYSAGVATSDWINTYNRGAIYLDNDTSNPDYNPDHTAENPSKNSVTWMWQNVSDVLGRYIYINGHSMAEILKSVETELGTDQGALIEAVCEIAVTGEQDTLTFRFNVSRAPEVLGTYIFQTKNFDESYTFGEGNVIEFKPGFQTPTGVVLEEHLMYEYDVNAGTWNSIEPKTYARMPVFTENQENSYHGTTIYFNEVVNYADDGNANILDDTMADSRIVPLMEGISVNGASLKTLQSEGKNFVLYVVSNADCEYPGSDKTSYLHLRDLGKDLMKYDGTDVLTIAAGMQLPSGKTTLEAQSFRLEDEEGQLVWKELTFSPREFLPLEKGEEVFEFDIVFENDIVTERMDDLIPNENVSRRVLINGTPISMIAAAAASAEGNTLSLTLPNAAFAWDNGDYVTVLKGFNAGTGETERSVTKYFNWTLAQENDGQGWVDFEVYDTLERSYGSIMNITDLVDNGDGTRGFSIVFDREISYKRLAHYNASDEFLQNVDDSLDWKYDSYDLYRHKYQPAYESVLNGFFINGQSLGELMAASAHNPDDCIAIHFNSDSINVIFNDLDKEGGGVLVDLEQDLEIEITTEFMSPTGVSLRKNYQGTLAADSDYWIHENPGVTGGSLARYFTYMPSLNSFAIQVKLDRSAGKIFMENIQKMDIVSRYVLVNGKTVYDIIAAEKAAGRVYTDQNGGIMDPVVLHYQQDGSDGYFVLNIFVHKDLAEADGGLLYQIVTQVQPDGSVTREYVPSEGNRVGVLKDLYLPCNFKLDRDYTYIYVDGDWREESDISTDDWQAIEILSVSAPEVAEQENVSFNIRFNRPITGTQLLHIAAGDDWLLSVSNQANPPFVYTADQLALFRKYGIVDSLLDNILFNGVSLRELKERETNQDLKATTIMVHLGTVDSSTLTIQFAGTVPATGADYANRITDLNQEFEFTFLAGVKTVNASILKEDVTFRYSPETGNFARVAEATPELVIENVYYNGTKIEENGTIRVSNIDALDERFLTADLGSESAVFEIEGNVLHDGVNELKLVARSGDGSKTAEFSFFVEKVTEQNNTGLIIGLSVGGGVLVLALAAVFVLWRMKKSKTGKGDAK